MTYDVHGDSRSMAIYEQEVESEFLRKHAEVSAEIREVEKCYKLALFSINGVEVTRIDTTSLLPRTKKNIGHLYLRRPAVLYP